MNVGVNLQGVTDVGTKGSNTKFKSSHYQHAHGRVEGTLHLDVDEMTLDGAILDLGQIKGRADTINVVTRQDKTEQRSTSWNLNSAGHVSASQSRSVSKAASEVSKLHVRDGINHDADYKFSTQEIKLVGGKITTEGENRLAADIIRAITITDVGQSSTQGFASNVGTVVRISRETTDKNSFGMQTIATITMGAKKKVTQHLATVSGGKEMILDVKHVVGQLNHDPDQATQVVVDESQMLDIRIPDAKPI